MSGVGHLRPMHSVPVPIDVRCYSNSDIIVRRNEVPLRATSRHCCHSLDHFVGDSEQIGGNFETE